MADWDDFSDADRESEEEPEEDTGEAEVDDPEDEPDTIEKLRAELDAVNLAASNRLGALESKTERLDGGLGSLGKAFAFTLVGGAAVFLVAFVAAHWDDGKPKDEKAIYEYTDEQVLKSGSHCYPDRAEMLAVRSRALEAVDRLAWQASHPAFADEDRVYGNAVHKGRIPRIRPVNTDPGTQTDEDKRIEDPNVCFIVDYAKPNW